MNTIFAAILIGIPVYTLIVWGGSWLASLAFTQFHILSFLQSLVIGLLITIIQYLFSSKGADYSEVVKKILELLYDIRAKLFEKDSATSDIDLSQEQNLKEERENWEAAQKGFYGYVRYLLMNNYSCKEDKERHPEFRRNYYFKSKLNWKTLDTLLTLAHIENIQSNSYRLFLRPGYNHLYKETVGTTDIFKMQEEGTEVYYFMVDSNKYKDSKYHSLNFQEKLKKLDLPKDIGSVWKFNNSVCIVTLFDPAMPIGADFYLIGLGIEEEDISYFEHLHKEGIKKISKDKEK